MSFTMTLNNLFPPQRGRWLRWLGNEHGQLGNTTTNQTRMPVIPGPSGMETSLAGANLPTLVGQDFTLGNAMNQEAQYLNGGPGSMYGGIQGLGGLAGQNLAGNVSGMQTFNPATINAVLQAYAAPQQQGELQLQRDASNAAAARGMSISDSPIGSAYLEQARQFENSIASGEAGSLLGQQNTQNQLDSSLLQFAQQTQQAGIGAQMQLAGANSPANNFQLGLGNQRIQSAGQQFQSVGTQPTATTLQNLSSGLFGNNAGGLVGGGSALLGTGLNFAGLGGLFSGNNAAGTPSTTQSTPTTWMQADPNSTLVQSTQFDPGSSASLDLGNFGF